MYSTGAVNHGLPPQIFFPIEITPLGLADQRPADTDNIANESKTIGKTKRVLEYGLKIFQQLAQAGEEFITPGQKTRQFTKGDRIGDYIYLGNKKRGIEPGFEAHKA